MTHPGTQPVDLARKAIRSVLAGNPPNGVVPAECGDWAPCVEGVYAGFAAGGTPKAQQVFASLCRTTPGLERMVNEDAPPASDWGGILPFHSADLPPFPLDIFPTWLREFCEAVTETMQTPPDLAGMLALSVLSTACARRIQVRARPGWEEPVNVFTVTSLPPASRKSPVFRAMMGPILMFEQKQTEKVRDQVTNAETMRDILGQKLAEARKQAARAKSDSDTRRAFDNIEEINEQIKTLIVPPMPKLIVDDITPETVASVLAEQGGRVSVLSSEGDIFAIMAGRYSAGAPNIGVYKKGHAGEDVRVDRRNRSEFIKQATITIGVTTQPEVLRSFGQNTAFRSEGLLARFFYALPRSTVGARQIVTPAIPDHVQSRYYRLMLDLLELFNSGNSGNSGNNTKDISGNSDKNLYIDDSTNITTIEISNTSNNILIGFQTWLEPQIGPYGEFSAIADWAGKLAGAVLRIAGLLHVADQVAHNSHNSQNTISDNEINRAIRLAHYLIPHAQAAYAEIGADPAVESAKLVLRWIEKSGVKTFTKRDCYQGVKGTLKRADDLDPILSLLCDHGFIREIEQLERASAGRRPSQPYDVNPAFGSSHNSHNSHNSPPPPTTPPGASYEPPTFREMEGYD